MNMFRFYTNAISQASKRIAAGIFILGLVLIGFGVIIIALPEIFALLAAVVFFIAGAGCATTAIRIFLTQRKIDKAGSEQPGSYRKNVRIHTEEYYDS